MYQGITVLEDFERWNDLYSKEKKIHLSQLPNKKYYENEGVVFKTPAGIPKGKEHGIVKGDYVHLLKKYTPCGVKAANTEQAIALELLRDENIPLITMFGSAGSRKNIFSHSSCLTLFK